MLTIGIDVAILGCFAIALIAAAFMARTILGLTPGEANMTVLATVVSSLTMLIAYIIMAHVLDAMLGAYGW